MPCALVILFFFGPRLTSFVLWLASDWFQGVFDTTLWPVLGFLFMPWTMLWYSCVTNWWDGSWSFGPILGLVVAILFDLASSSGRSSSSSSSTT